MVKDCPIHGHFEDVMAIDTAFFQHLEEVFPGRDIRAHNDATLHNHGSSTITHGRGSVLTIDLTNRCNMMCDPCFMDANQVGFVHELSWEDIKTLLDNAITIKPKRQMSVQFSGGEPTLSPYFLDAVRYAREVGYTSVQAATNGIEFAKSPEFCRQAAEAGLRYAYLQFDGIGNAANSHRKVGNLFDVKLRAIENLYANGVDIIPVITIVNGINNEQVGRIVQFALDNPKKIPFLSFQPVSFTGRDEAVTDERRAAQRYTLSHLAHDVKNQTGLGEPARDWFPISFMSTFSDWSDLVHGPQADWGQLSCGCHPNCGVGMAVMVDKETKESAPVTAFLNADRLARDVARINDAARGKWLSVIGMALAVARNYDPFQAPTHFKLSDLLKKFDKTFGATGKNYGKVGKDRTFDDIEKRRRDRWNFLFIAGMWFQDLFNYDFRRTEQCIIPYATQEGEISFCAYNTGVGWRNIIEKIEWLSVLGMALAVARNYDPFQAPTHFRFGDLLKKFDKTFGATGKSYGKVGKDRTFDDIERRRRDRWNFLFIAGMWFQDLFNYDFRRTEQCIIPYATQEGEISFCAYNTGVGWRNIIEKMHMTATLTKWYEERGKHEIFAGGKHVPLASAEHSLMLREEIVTTEEQHDLDRLGIAKNAREEKMRARDARLKERQEQERMLKLYRQHVLKEQPAPDLVQIAGGPAPAPRRAEEPEEVGSFGD